MKALVLVLLLSLLALVPLQSQAAFDGIVISSTPEHPKPGTAVTLSASAIGVGARQMYTWTVDGNEVLRGVDVRELTIAAPNAGGVTKISVSVISGNKAIATGTYILQPAGVTIEWEGTGGVPPTYTGRPLMTAHGAVHADAIPTFLASDGASVPGSQILYMWEVNGQKQDKLSGVGRSSVVVASPFYNQPFTLSVTAVARSGTLVANDAVTIAPRSPSLVVYETTPLGGLQDSIAINDEYPFDTAEVSFMAYPLNATVGALSTFSWELNGRPVGLDTGDPRLAIFKKVSGGSGQFSVGVLFENPNAFLDRASSGFILSF